MANYAPWPVNALVASYAPVASYTPVANYALMASVTLSYSLSTDIKDRLDSEDKNKETQYGRWTSNTCQDETHLSHPIDWQFGSLLEAWLVPHQLELHGQLCPHCSLKTARLRRSGGQGRVFPKVREEYPSLAPAPLPRKLGGSPEPRESRTGTLKTRSRFQRIWRLSKDRPFWWQQLQK
ncbi:hypothetical protein C8J56DRAFT_885631 [Mycena floridula]|nr:hypothetical protein C8J56DRAFT_885631 [Mycena floridula]